MEVSTLRPGILVSLKTSIHGNIAYRKIDTERERKDANGVSIAKWETTRKIEDPDEFEAAKKIRQDARQIVARVCANTAFGLLCPEADSDILQNAITDAQALVKKFNDVSKITKVGVYVISGKVAQDDVQAVQAINSEVRDLLDDMKEGIEALDVKRIRDAANKARSIGQMLQPDTAARITTAIEAARKSAREIVKAGENASQAIDQRTLRVLSESRTAFLDLDEGKAVAAPKATGRAVDLAPEGEVIELRRPTPRKRAAAEV